MVDGFQLFLALVSVFVVPGVGITSLYVTITLLLPGSFSHISAENTHKFGQLLYFSLTTLTTTGYGDIVPLHAASRSLSNLESVCGQIYLATLLARLVNLQLAQNHRQTLPSPGVTPPVEPESQELG